MERSLYWYIGTLRILTNTYTTALTTKQAEEEIRMGMNLPYVEGTGEELRVSDKIRSDKIRSTF